MIDEHGPHVVAVERVFAQQNRQTVMGTAQASGIALLIAGERGLPAATHTPTEVKAAVTGYGAADKRQVQTMVARVLRLDAASAARGCRRRARARALPRLARRRGARADDRRSRPRSARGRTPSDCDAAAERVASNKPAKPRLGSPHDLLLRGTAVHVDAGPVVVEVGGVGLAVAVTPHVARATHVGDDVHPAHAT